MLKEVDQADTRIRKVGVGLEFRHVHKSHSVGVVAVMTALCNASDFVYHLPFLFSLYHHPEPSGMLYGNTHSRPSSYDVE